MNWAQISRALLGIVVWGCLPLTAIAQTDAYPSHAIQIVVPFPPGASTDLLARFIAPQLSEKFGKPVIVENRPGAGGLIGAAYVANARPDGHTLLVASSTTLQSPLLQKTPTLNVLKQLAPVTAAFQHPFVVVSSATLPVHNFPELIAYAKEHPGKLNSASLGGFSDAISVLFRNAAGVQIEVVPYRGAAEAMIGLIRGDSHLMFNPYSAMQSQVQAGKLRMLAVTTVRRSPTLPDLPTLDEQGLKGFDILNVVGVLAPAHTSPEIVNRLSNEITTIMRSPAGREFLRTNANDPVQDSSPEAYRRQIAEANDHIEDELTRIGFAKR